MVKDLDADQADYTGWSRWVRLGVSAWLIVHLAAVFVPPFAFETSTVRGMGSPVAESAMRLLQPYIDAFYLNHGYAFFAPDPGPSHLLRARLEFSDGREPLELTLPDLQRHWPRLLYHRHFMLSEHLHSSFAPSELPPSMAADRFQAENWRRAFGLYRARKRAIVRHLKSKYQAERVTLTRIEHRLLDPFELTALGKDLADPDTYLELSEGAPPEVGP